MRLGLSVEVCLYLPLFHLLSFFSSISLFSYCIFLSHYISLVRCCSEITKRSEIGSRVCVTVHVNFCIFIESSVTEGVELKIFSEQHLFLYQILSFFLFPSLCKFYWGKGGTANGLSPNIALFLSRSLAVSLFFFYPLNFSFTPFFFLSLSGIPKTNRNLPSKRKLLTFRGLFWGVR